MKKSLLIIPLVVLALALVVKENKQATLEVVQKGSVVSTERVHEENKVAKQELTKRIVKEEIESIEQERDTETLVLEIERLGFALDEKTAQLEKINSEFDLKPESEAMRERYEEIKGEAIELHRKYLAASNRYQTFLTSKFNNVKVERN